VGALLHGGRLVLIESETRLSPDLYLDVLEREAVSVVCPTPCPAVEQGLVQSLFGGAQSRPRLRGRVAFRHVGPPAQGDGAVASTLVIRSERWPTTIPNDLTVASFTIVRPSG
jgi:hypothetical protein